jgi:hypothetical protein
MLTGIPPRGVPKILPNEVNHYLESIIQVIKEICSSTPYLNQGRRGKKKI